MHYIDLLLIWNKIFLLSWGGHVPSDGMCSQGGSKECVGIFGLDSESRTWLSQGLKAALCRFFFLSCLVAAAVAASQSHSTTVVRLCI